MHRRRQGSPEVGRIIRTSGVRCIFSPAGRVGGDPPPPGFLPCGPSLVFLSFFFAVNGPASVRGEARYLGGPVGGSAVLWSAGPLRPFGLVWTLCCSAVLGAVRHSVSIYSTELTPSSSERGGLLFCIWALQCRLL